MRRPFRRPISQYFGCFGSISVTQAITPPVRLRALVKPLLAHHRDRSGAASAALAMDDDLLIRIEFAELLRELRHGDQEGAGDAADGVLVRLAHVDDNRRIPAGPSALSIRGR